jgi:hypothetical protein
MPIPSATSVVPKLRAACALASGAHARALERHARAPRRQLDRDAIGFEAAVTSNLRLVSSMSDFAITSDSSAQARERRERLQSFNRRLGRENQYIA